MASFRYSRIRGVPQVPGRPLTAVTMLQACQALLTERAAHAGLGFAGRDAAEYTARQVCLRPPLWPR